MTPVSVVMTVLLLTGAQTAQAKGTAQDVLALCSKPFVNLTTQSADLSDLGFARITEDGSDEQISRVLHAEAMLNTVYSDRNFDDMLNRLPKIWGEEYAFLQEIGAQSLLSLNPKAEYTATFLNGDGNALFYSVDNRTRRQSITCAYLSSESAKVTADAEVISKRPQRYGEVEFHDTSEANADLWDQALSAKLTTIAPLSKRRLAWHLPDFPKFQSAFISQIYGRPKN